MAPLLLLPMTRQVFRVLRNIKGVKHTNSLYGLYPHSGDVDIGRGSTLASQRKRPASTASRRATVW